MVRQIIWLLAGLLALAVLGLMILTPTPPKGDGRLPVEMAPR